MVTSTFALVVDGAIVPLYVVNTMSFGGTQSVIVYEAPGTNGGTVITTGRTNNKITLNGKIVRQAGLTLNEVKAQLQRIRDAAKVVRLLAPIDNDDTGSYVIEEFTGTVIEGTPGYLSFSMTLQEYRQANIQTRAVNLVNFGPADALKQRLTDLNLLENS